MPLGKLTWISPNGNVTVTVDMDKLQAKIDYFLKYGDKRVWEAQKQEM